MNDIGMTLAWSSVRVSLVLVPAVAITILASRRSPLSGSWGAAMGLAIVVMLTLFGFVSWPERANDVAFEVEGIKFYSSTSNVNTRISHSERQRVSDLPSRSAEHSSFSLSNLRGYWSRLKRQSTSQANRIQVVVRYFALISIAGSSFGFFRLAMGLWAVSLCRRRGTPVHDVELLRVRDVFRARLGIRREVEIREVSDLSAPATAGWLRPLIMLPEDWPTWDDSERRAVLAHELAHINRRDYGVGLVARLAVILNYYHPVVRWLSNRLQLQQELAADAIGAEVAGGRGVYLRALSSLALRQEGRVSHWPARSFLPARGTLIRRIAMLRCENTCNRRPWSVTKKIIAASMLLSVATGVASLRSPALAEEPKPKTSELITIVPSVMEPKTEAFDLSYIPESAQGFAAIRPAALLRRTGMSRFGWMLNAGCADVLAPIAKAAGVKLAEPNKGPLRVEMIEQASCSIEVQTLDVKKGPKHRLITHMLMARTTEPFDWLKLAREWKLEPTEARLGDKTYYKIQAKWVTILGPGTGAFFCPDDRTVVFDDEQIILKILGRDKTFSSPYIKDNGWEQVSRGLFAVALDNRNGKWTDSLDQVHNMHLLRDANFWCGGVADSDEIVLQAIATCKHGAGAGATAGAVSALIEIERKDELKVPDGPKSDLAFKLFTGLLKNVKVEHIGKTVTVHSSVAETLADFGDVVTGGN